MAKTLSDKKLTFFAENRVITIKAGVTVETLREHGFFERHPDAIKVTVPSNATLNKWAEQGYCKAVDGCKIEMDGTCSHGKPSWLLVAGLI